MDIPAALTILRNSPLEALRQHTSDTLSTLEELRYRLRDMYQHEGSEVTNSPGCCVCRRTISRMTGDDAARNTSLIPRSLALPDQRLPNKQPRVDDTIRGSGKSKRPTKPRPIVLFEALTAELPGARNFTIKNKPSNLYLRQQMLQGDRRLNDILRVEGNPNPTLADKLLRGAAQRSLAMQYSNYQRREGKTSRVDELCDLLSSQNADRKGKLRNGRGGGIIKWVREKLHYEKEKEKVVTNCVNCGIKQLVMEGLFQRRLLPSAQTPKASGISALTALTITPFKNLHLEEIPSFLDRVFAGSSNEDMPVAATQKSITPCNLLNVIDTLSGWFEKFLDNYHKGLSVPSQEFDLPPSSKHTSDADPPREQFVEQESSLESSESPPEEPVRDLPSISPVEPHFELGEISTSPQSMSPSITNAETNTTQSHTSSAAATPCDRRGGDIDIISSTSSRPHKDYSVSSPSSHQTSIAGEESSSGDSLTEQIAARNDSAEDFSPATQNADCASMCYHSELNAEFAQSMLASFDNLESSPERPSLAPNEPLENLSGTQCANAATGISHAGLAGSRPSGTARCLGLTGETDEARRRKRRRISNDTDIIRHVERHPSNIDQLQPEFHHPNSAEWGPVPLIAAPKGLSGPQNAVENYLQFAGTLHSCAPQLDNVQLDNIAAETDQEMTQFNPLASNALFSLFPSPQLDNVQFDNVAVETGQETTRFNPLASNALFSLFPSHQLDNVQLDNIAVETGQETTRFNPLASNSLFSLFPSPELDNIAAEADQETTRFDPLASNALFSPFSNSPLDNTPAKIGLNSTRIDCATSEVF